MKIAIFGTVGAGKTTVSNKLAEKLNYTIFPEPIDDNPYFNDYYNDIKNNAFKMQIYMLTARSKQMLEAGNLENIIFDRTILEDTFFTKLNYDLGNITEVDYKTYTNFYEYVVLENLKASCENFKFDLIVYLRVDTEKSIERIKTRGRQQEQQTENRYWAMLNENYEEFYKDNKNLFPFFEVNANDDDVDSKVDKIINKINEIKMNNKRD